MVSPVYVWIICQTFGRCSWTSWNEWFTVFPDFCATYLIQKSLWHWVQKLLSKPIYPATINSPATTAVVKLWFLHQWHHKALNSLNVWRLHYTCSHEIYADEAHEYRLYQYKCQWQHIKNIEMSKQTLSVSAKPYKHILQTQVVSSDSSQDFILSNVSRIFDHQFLHFASRTILFISATWWYFTLQS